MLKFIKRDFSRFRNIFLDVRKSLTEERMCHSQRRALQRNIELSSSTWLSLRIFSLHNSLVLFQQRADLRRVLKLFPARILLQVMSQLNNSFRPVARQQASRRGKNAIKTAAARNFLITGGGEEEGWETRRNFLISPMPESLCRALETPLKSSKYLNVGGPTVRIQMIRRISIFVKANLK